MSVRTLRAAGATATSCRGELSVASLLIGCVGCVIITASSVYTALKMGSLPWPTIFTSVTSLVLLRAVGRTSLQEANVTQVIMSAGSMVAGGLAFTIPAAWMLGVADGSEWLPTIGVATAGVLLGLVCTALVRHRLVEESELPYPVGTAAARTLQAGAAGGGTGVRLFGSMAAAGVWCVLRDVAGVVPKMIGAVSVPGVATGIYASPMLLSVGFLLSATSALLWITGAVLGNIGLVIGGTAAGWWNAEVARGVVSSLGMGIMMGSGFGVVVRDVLPQLWSMVRAVMPRGDKPAVAEQCTRTGWGADIASRLDASVLALLVAAAALVVCVGLGFPPVVAVVVVLLSFVTTIMSAQSVGQTGIDPMEVFGLIVLLLVAAFSDVSQVRLIYVAGVIAVACGLAGDVMSDFKTGALLGANPRTLWFGQAIGATLGVVISVATLTALVAAWGPSAFGPTGTFVAAQASVVATVVSGIPSVPAFVVGLVAGALLYLAGVPSMMIGLGVYLPFYMSFTAFLGSLVRRIYDMMARRRGVDAERAAEQGTIVASGLLGGESIVGVCVALATVLAGLLG